MSREEDHTIVAPLLSTAKKAKTSHDKNNNCNDEAQDSSNRGDVQQQNQLPSINPSLLSTTELLQLLADRWNPTTTTTSSPPFSAPRAEAASTSAGESNSQSSSSSRAFFQQTMKEVVAAQEMLTKVRSNNIVHYMSMLRSQSPLLSLNKDMQLMILSFLNQESLWVLEKSSCLVDRKLCMQQWRNLLRAEHVELHSFKNKLIKNARDHGVYYAVASQFVNKVLPINFREEEQPNEFYYTPNDMVDGTCMEYDRDYNDTNAWFKGDVGFFVQISHNNGRILYQELFDPSDVGVVWEDEDSTLFEVCFEMGKPKLLPMDDDDIYKELSIAVVSFSKLDENGKSQTKLVFLSRPGDSDIRFFGALWAYRTPYRPPESDENYDVIIRLSEFVDNALELRLYVPMEQPRQRFY